MSVNVPPMSTPTLNALTRLLPIRSSRLISRHPAPGAGGQSSQERHRVYCEGLGADRHVRLGFEGHDDEIAEVTR